MVGRWSEEWASVKGVPQGLLKHGGRRNKGRKGLNDGITVMERGRHALSGVQKQQRGKGSGGGER